MSLTMMPSIQTASGRYVNFLDPASSRFLIEDIAHALSQLCRFTGHTRRFYSVAQHSVMVSQLVPAEHALHGLLHDATEAYLGDVSSPLKQLLPDYRDLERRMTVEIFRQFGLDGTLPGTVKHADLVMLCTERRDLMGEDDDTEWPMLAGIEPRDVRITPWTPHQAREIFMAQFRELTAKEVA